MYAQKVCKTGCQLSPGLPGVVVVAEDLDGLQLLQKPVKRAHGSETERPPMKVGGMMETPVHSALALSSSNMPNEKT